MSFQKQHAEDSILLKLADYKSLLNGLVSNAAHQLYNTIERDARPIGQGAILPVIWFHLVLDPSAEGVKDTAADEVGGAA